MLILASKSPRREEILRNAGFSFEIVPSDKDEIIIPNLAPSKVAGMIADAKAKDIAFRFGDNNIIVGADTIVVIDNDILGKPSGKEDAFYILNKLSGARHKVITGVCIIKDKLKISFTESTVVEFYPLSRSQIEEYIETKEPFDKAGAYGIQEKGALFVKKINGDYFNVMGLPIARLARILNKLMTGS